MDHLMARSGGVCEFCGATDGLAAVMFAPAGEVLLCQTCRDPEAPAAHWRCLEGAAWSVEPAVQFAVAHSLADIPEAWAQEARNNMQPDPQVAEWLAADAAAVVHRDSNGVVLEQGDTVVLIKDLPVKGAGFTAKRGTAVRGISLVADNAAHIEGRVEGQRIVILTEFVKKR
ncbi:PhnA domain-containing protein [Paracoccus jiaweipingae]|uniref:PhnA domain-containing protein n=1 Tax=unclassified Paracoccus (in: a-proteobacteria) TaxID=2688777 RepID=UPI0037B7F238